MLAFLLLFACPPGVQEAPSGPNILWITIDDCGPDFASYGNELVLTPNLDRLAVRGMRYTSCFASTPVCSPVRSALITGCHATTIGAHQHRSKRPLPQGVRPLPEILAEHGWRPTFLPHQRVDPEAFAQGASVDEGHFPVVSASNKEDFNFSRGAGKRFQDWDPEHEGPFFALIDFHAPKVGQGTGRAHQWARAAGHVVDPAELALPPYWVDAPAVRDAYARYHEGVSLLDAEVGQLLAWLEREDLRDDTLLFVVGDHGLAMLRHKQWCYDTGLRVPLIVQGPGIDPGVSHRLVSTIDLAAATLAACGIEQPGWMESRDFLFGEAEPREHVFASRDRCDETEDRVRAIRTEDWKLIHNLRPELPWVGRNVYTRRTFPNVKRLEVARRAGVLTPTQALFMRKEKPEWELYDVNSDPLELTNLAGETEHAQVQKRLRVLLDAWVEETDARNPFPEPLENIVPEKVRAKVTEQRG